jgi:hypothetical protein
LVSLTVLLSLSNFAKALFRCAGAGEEVGEVWDKPAAVLGGVRDWIEDFEVGGELVGVVQVDLVPHDPEVQEAADHLGDAVADGAEVDGEDLGQVRGRGNSAGVPKVAEVEIWEGGLGVGPVEENAAGSCVS